MITIPAVGMMPGKVSDFAVEGPAAQETPRGAGVGGSPTLPYPRGVEHDVRFKPSGRKVRVERGTSLLEAARRAGIPVARACGGHGLCAGCGMIVLRGGGNLPAETPRERDAKRANRVDPSMRLSCLVELQGDVVVTTHYW
jgi:2Fe-2S ferredoxin